MKNVTIAYSSTSNVCARNNQVLAPPAPTPTTGRAYVSVVVESRICVQHVNHTREDAQHCVEQVQDDASHTGLDERHHSLAHALMARFSELYVFLSQSCVVPANAPGISSCGSGTSSAAQRARTVCWARAAVCRPRRWTRVATPLCPAVVYHILNKSSSAPVCPE